MAAGAGMLQVLLNKKVGPEILSTAYTVDPLLMTIIGGIGTLNGPIVGATGLHLLDVFFRDASFTVAGTTVNIASVWGLILGGVVLALVALAVSLLVYKSRMTSAAIQASAMRW